MTNESEIDAPKTLVMPTVVRPSWPASRRTVDRRNGWQAWLKRSAISGPVRSVALVRMRSSAGLPGSGEGLHQAVSPPQFGGVRLRRRADSDIVAVSDN